MSEPKLWIASQNILSRAYPIAHAYREEPFGDNDSGWRLVSDGDTPEVVADPANVVTLTYEEVLEIEPAFDQVKDLPAGSEISLIQEEFDTVFVDYETRQPVL